MRVFKVNNKLSSVLIVLVFGLIFIGGGCLNKQTPAPVVEDELTNESEMMTEDLGEDIMEKEDNTIEKDDDVMEGSDDGVANLHGTGQMTIEYVITGKNFSFSESEIQVSQGDRVKIRFTSTDGLHNWVVDEFNAATERVSTGDTAFVEFVADKKGTFEYYCSVGNHRQLGMKGNLIVE